MQLADEEWFISGPTCERRIKNIPFKPLSERMMEEPFWLGLLAVFVVLGILGTGFMLKKHLPDKFDKLFSDGNRDGAGKTVGGKTSGTAGGGGGGAGPASILGTVTNSQNAKFFLQIGNRSSSSFFSIMKWKMRVLPCLAAVQNTHPS